MENQELLNKPSKKLKPLLLFSLLGIVILVAIIILVNRKNQSLPSANQPAGQEPAGASTGTGEANTADSNLQNAAKLVGARVVAPGANPITKDNKVVTEKGAPTDNSVAPMSETAPKQTDFLEKDKLSSADVVKIDVGNDKFSPKEFESMFGAPTSFSLTSIDNEAHYITFDDPSLSAILIFVGPQQTKAITFNAPAKAGEYTFRCGLPGHADKGEVGKMIVR